MTHRTFLVGAQLLIAASVYGYDVLTMKMVGVGYPAGANLKPAQGDVPCECATTVLT